MADLGDWRAYLRRIREVRECPQEKLTAEQKRLLRPAKSRFSYNSLFGKDKRTT